MNKPEPNNTELLALLTINTNFTEDYCNSNYQATQFVQVHTRPI